LTPITSAGENEKIDVRTIQRSETVRVPSGDERGRLGLELWVRRQTNGKRTGIQKGGRKEKSDFLKSGIGPADKHFAGRMLWALFEGGSFEMQKKAGPCTVKKKGECIKRSASPEKNSQEYSLVSLYLIGLQPKRAQNEGIHAGRRGGNTVGGRRRTLARGTRVEVPGIGIQSARVLCNSRNTPGKHTRKIFQLTAKIKRGGGGL